MSSIFIIHLLQQITNGQEVLSHTSVVRLGIITFTMANKDFERLDNEYDAISKLLEEKDAEYFDREHPKTLVWHRESIAITKRLFSRLHVLLTEAKTIGYTELEVYIKERLTFVLAGIS